jgi:hypothetical protein
MPSTLTHRHEFRNHRLWGISLLFLDHPLSHFSAMCFGMFASCQSAAWFELESLAAAFHMLYMFSGPYGYLGDTIPL